MDISTLKSHIKNNTPEHVYIFIGPEWKIQQIYIQKMSESFNMEAKYVDSFASIYSKLNNKSFITSSYIYIIRDDTDIQNNESIQTNLNKLLGDNILVLLLTNPDKRTKFYKKFEDRMCIFEALTPAILKKYIEKEINLSDANCDKLMEICEYDYGRCLLEINKIKTYQVAHSKDIFPNDAFNILLKEGTIYVPPKDAIFEFVDAILDKNVVAFKLYEDCKAVNEATMVMLSVLYNNAKATLQVQSYEGNDISKGTGLNNFQIINARKHAGKRKNSNLIRIMKLCTEFQKQIVTGEIEEEYVIDYLLGEIL